jgi:hypothetical protein
MWTPLLLLSVNFVQRQVSWQCNSTLIVMLIVLNFSHNWWSLGSGHMDQIVGRLPWFGSHLFKHAIRIKLVQHYPFDDYFKEITFISHPCQRKCFSDIDKKIIALFYFPFFLCIQTTHRPQMTFCICLTTRNFSMHPYVSPSLFSSFLDFEIFMRYASQIFCIQISLRNYFASKCSVGQKYALKSVTKKSNALKSFSIY